MLTLKESESDEVSENTDESLEDGEEGNNERRKKGKFTIANGGILRNALLSMSDEHEPGEEEVLPETSTTDPESCVTSTSAITHWEELKSDGSVSYVTSVPHGKEFIIITQLEPVKTETDIDTSLNRSENTICLDKGSKSRHRSKRHNKVLLLRKLVSNHEQAELSQAENLNMASEVKQECISNVAEISYDEPTLEDALEQQGKEGNNWLKSFRPLPLYYTERGKPYLKCPACGAMFFTSTFFQKHLFSHMFKEEDMYMCSYCSYSHIEPGMLFAHLTKHQDQCEFCNENLMRKNNFEKHWDMCSPTFCIKRDRRGRFVCTACKLVFDLLAQLEKHWFKHSCTRERIYQCKECGGLYESKETLQNHKCLKCPVCGEIYDNLHRLKAHTMWTKHNLKCPICSYEFILTMDHEKHLAMHREVYRPTKDHAHCLQSADGKTFQCNLCDKIFYALPRLVLHLQEDHGVENVKKEGEPEKKKLTVEELSSKLLKVEPVTYGNAHDNINQLNDAVFQNVL